MSGQIDARRGYTKTSRLLQLFMLLVVSTDSMSNLKAIKISDTVVDATALTIQGTYGRAINGLTFQQSAVVTHRGYQYVAYYDKTRHVSLARRKLPAGSWSVLRFSDYRFSSNDAHNTISMGICPKDGTIHLAFDHHNSPLHYRVSRKDAATKPDAVTWDASLFGPVTSRLEGGAPISLTYPRFWQTPQGELQFNYRRGKSGGGERMLVDYDPATGKWINTRQIDSGKGSSMRADRTRNFRSSYPNGYDYGPDGKLHATWVWRDNNQRANHDLMYAYSEDQGNTWFNNAGRHLAWPPFINSPGITVANIGPEYGLVNTNGQAVDSEGRVHVVMWHCPEQALKAVGRKRGGEIWWCPATVGRYHHYWRENDAKWVHTELPRMAGNRPKVFIDANNNAYLIFRASKLFLGQKHLEASEIDRGKKRPQTSELDRRIQALQLELDDLLVRYTERHPDVRELNRSMNYLKEQRAQIIAETPPNASQARIAPYKGKNNPVLGPLHPPGALLIAAATSASKWTDWKVIHTEKGPFVNEMLGDLYRWKTSGILSIMVQEAPKKAHEATPLRILDFSLEQE